MKLVALAFAASGVFMTAAPASPNLQNGDFPSVEVRQNFNMAVMNPAADMPKFDGTLLFTHAAALDTVESMFGHVSNTAAASGAMASEAVRQAIASDSAWMRGGGSFSAPGLGGGSGAAMAGMGFAGGAWGAGWWNAPVAWLPGVIPTVATSANGGASNGGGALDASATDASTPEPEGLFLLGAGILGLALLLRHKLE